MIEHDFVSIDDTPIRSFCKIDMGLGRVGLSLGCHCGVTYQISGLYVNPFSKFFFVKMRRWGPYYPIVKKGQTSLGRGGLILF